MDQHFRARVAPHRLLHVPGADGVVHHAAAVVEEKLFFRQLGGDKMREMLVGNKENAPVRQRPAYRQRIGGRHAHIREHFQFRRRIDVAHDRRVRILRLYLPHARGVRHVRHRAVRRRVRQQDGLLRI